MSPFGKAGAARGRLCTAANALTACRALLAFPLTYGVRQGDFVLACSAGALFGLLDVLDGELARRTRSESAFGSWFDSAVDRAFFLVALASVATTGVMGLLPLAIIVVSLTIQMACGAWYAIAKDPRRPKTLLGTVVGILLLLRIGVTLNTAAADALEIAAAVVAVDNTWYYAKPILGWIHAPRIRNPWPDSRIRRNFSAKLRGECPPSTQLFTIPNLITVGRTIPGAIGVLALANGAFLLAACMAATFVTLDVLDGYVARELGQVSKLGALLDPILDKTAAFAAVFTLAMLELLPIWLVAVVAIRIAIIATSAAGLRLLLLRLPRNVWSVPAWAGVAVVFVSNTEATRWLVVALNSHNAAHYLYQTGQILQTTRRAHMAGRHPSQERAGLDPIPVGAE